MGFAGQLATFSLPEIFQTLERGRKTGCLSLHPAHSTAREDTQYLWLSQGHIVAAADASNKFQLLNMVIQRRWLSQSIQAHWELLRELETPLGLFFKDQGLLKPEQLQILFHFQVLQRVAALLKWQNGQFNFDEQSFPSNAEMTGLSISPSSALLLALRVLKDWEPLMDKLPQPHAALAKAFQTHSAAQLDLRESKVLGFAQGTVSLQDMAQKMAVSLENIQQIAFRLIAIGLVEEVPVRLPGLLPEWTLPPLPMPPDPQPIATPQTTLISQKATPSKVTPSKTTQPKVTQSFVHHLLGFLRSKV